jgi:hypothetical protein
MDDLVQWLRAQLDEDERIARAAMDAVGPVPGAAQWRYTASLTDEGGQYWSITTVTPSDTVPTVELVGSGMSGGGVHKETLARHIAEHDPARALREVEAKRRTLDRHTSHSMGGCRVCEAPHWGVQVCNHCYGKAWPCPDILNFAMVYADRPGYREAWRP